MSDVLWLAEIGHGIGDGVVVLEMQQGHELVLIKFFHSDADIVREHDVEKDLLLAVEMRADVELGSLGAPS